MELNCDNIGPRVTYVVDGHDAVMEFKNHSEQTSVCRQLFIALYYPRFKELVRFQMHDGVVHLTAPSSLSIEQAEESKLERQEGQGSDGSPVARMADPNKYELMASALVARVKKFPQSFQLKHLSTTLVMVGAVTGILNRSPEFDLKEYWDSFGDQPDDADQYLYVAARGLAGLPPNKKLRRQLKKVPVPSTQRFSEMTKSAGKKDDKFWYNLTNALSLDWLNAYAMDYMNRNPDREPEARAVVEESIAFLEREDVEQAMSASLRIEKNVVAELCRRRINFLTQVVFNSSAYGVSMLGFNLFSRDLLDKILAWLLKWHKRLTATPAIILTECDLVAQVGTCILILCLVLDQESPAEVVKVSQSALARRTDCPAGKPDSRALATCGPAHPTTRDSALGRMDRSGA